MCAYLLSSLLPFKYSCPEKETVGVCETKTTWFLLLTWENCIIKYSLHRAVAITPGFGKCDGDIQKRNVLGLAGFLCPAQGLAD